jgi:protein-disulfide isomerase
MRTLIALAAAAALTACGDGGSIGNGTAAAPVQGTQAPAGQSWTEVVEKTAEGYRMGNPNAPIKLVEYGSRTCPTCGAFGREGMQPLEANYVKSGKVSYEFRDFLVHGAPDLAAGLLGHCGGAQPFFPILEQMYQNQESYLTKLQATDAAFQQRLQGQAPGAIATAWAEQMGMIDFVKQRGIPEAQARKCLTDTAAIDALVKVTDDASKAGTVSGTPTFLINDKPVPNTVTWAQLETALKDAGA